MRIKERYDGVIAYFQDTMPVAESELNYSNPFELLVAVILSAQCTDKRVNLTLPSYAYSPNWGTSLSLPQMGLAVA